MSRQDANAAFARSSFLYGGNADYIEVLHAQYQKNPGSVDTEWQEFFGALKDDPGAIEKSAKGPSWEKPNWPIHAHGDLVAALDGQWAAVEKQLGDKIKSKAQSKGVDIGASDVQQAARDSILP